MDLKACCLWAVVVLCFVYQASAITCYTCTVQEPQCEHLNTTNAKTKPCDDAYDQCVKTVSITKVLNDQTGDMEDRYTVVTRECATSKEYKDECWEAVANQGKTIRCFCSSDKCNSAPSTRSYFSLLALPLLALFR